MSTSTKNTTNVNLPEKKIIRIKTIRVACSNLMSRFKYTVRQHNLKPKYKLLMMKKKLMSSKTIN